MSPVSAIGPLLPIQHVRCEVRSVRKTGPFVLIARLSHLDPNPTSPGSANGRTVATKSKRLTIPGHSTALRRVPSVSLPSRAEYLGKWPTTTLARSGTMVLSSRALISSAIMTKRL